MRRLIAIGLFVLALSGCTHTIGRKFDTPSPDAFALGKTTQDEISARYGAPYRQNISVFSSPDEISRSAPDGPFDPAHVAGTFTSLEYVYGEMNPPIAGGGIATKTLVLTFKDRSLIGYYFNSSFPVDYRPVDQNALGSINKGKTTRAETIQTFGTPTGRAIYPAVHTEGENKDIYVSSKVDNAINQLTVTRLEILFGADGVVRDFKFTSNTFPALQVVSPGYTPTYMPIFIPMKK